MPRTCTGDAVGGEGEGDADTEATVRAPVTTQAAPTAAGMPTEMVVCEGDTDAAVGCRIAGVADAGTWTAGTVTRMLASCDGGAAGWAAKPSEVTSAEAAVVAGAKMEECRSALLLTDGLLPVVDMMLVP